LDYAALGLRVLPLAPADKCPNGRLVRHGVKQATNEPRVVGAWWTAAPDANVGIACEDGLVVLDVDPRNGGDVTLAAQLRAAGAGLPPGPEVHTGGGGRHHYFAAPRPTRCTQLGPGLELKATGGYVVAPPSVHPSGRVYAWHPARTLTDPASLPPLPEWVARLADRDRDGKPAGSSPDERARWALAGAGEGERRQAALALAGHLLARGVDPQVALGLLQAWRLTRAAPGAHPFSAAELERIVADLVRREADRRRALG
jgi:hypothetical protein